MDLGIQNKVALVTAASKGLGKAAARALSLEGPVWRLLPGARRPCALQRSRSPRRRAVRCSQCPPM